MASNKKGKIGSPFDGFLAEQGILQECEEQAIKQHRTRARTTVARTAASAASKLYSPNKYHQVPRGAEKMFDANWQPKAFVYQ